MPLGGKAGGFALLDAADYAMFGDICWRRNVRSQYVMGETRDEAGRRHTVLLHRVLLGLARGDCREADHRNLDRLDHRRCNLRILTKQQNMQNRRAYRGSTSKHRGVSWSKKAGKWEAEAMVSGKRHYLGLYEDEDEAGRIAAEFRAEAMPFSKV